ncbi:WD40 repeat domain-containing protein [Kibdelosporangium aridum]|uniref:WD40 repeat n=1 Tax=Kibdelosporangium aridum TaxID=2030 RepID=A0A1W2FFW6_KIBAR|nr:WD40 repeat domain-containing protein [Kibdelosporangium aridum]SMD20821.1 WD40 repeat [Kibdelosporangium aridum]
MARPEKPVSSHDPALAAFATDLRRLRAEAGTPTYRELSAVAHYSSTVLSEAASGKSLPTLAVTLAFVRACSGDVDSWRARWLEIAEDSGEKPDEEAPYVGMTAFQPDDAGKFFGREELVEDIRARLRERSFLAVFGASGAGKSSVLRAGLAAAWIKEKKPVLVVTPGAHPPHPQAENDLLVVVDQFEELFTLCEDTAERDRFIQRILALPKVVIGVRADFYAHCAQYPALVEALKDAQVLIGPMTPGDLSRAITAPAVHAGFMVETALVSRLTAEAVGEPGVLPLLSHALLETWRRRRGNRMTLAGYEETGGLQHAIARTAEEAFLALNDAQQVIAQQVMLRLAAVGQGTDDTKRRARRQEFDDNPGTVVVLERFAQARLIMLDQDCVEVVHEVLMRSWPRFAEWLSADREGRRVHRQLTSATDEWESHGRDPGTLYRGIRLTVARDWANSHQDLLSAREKAFLHASNTAETMEYRRTRSRARRLKQLVALLVVLVLVAVGGVTTAVMNEQKAAEQHQLAIVRKAVNDANAMRTANPALARQIALAAYRLAPIPEARDALISITASPNATRVAGSAGPIRSVAFSPKGRLLATGSEDKNVVVWDADFATPRMIATLIGHEDVVNAVAFSADSRTLVSASRDNTVRLWNVSNPSNPQRLHVLTGHTGGVTSLAFTKDGRTLVTGSTDGTIRLWDLTNPASPQRIGLLSELGEITAVAVKPDADVLVSGGRDGMVRLWDIADARNPVPLTTLDRHIRASVLAVAFSPDGRTLATSGTDWVAQLWDVREVWKPTPVSVLTGQFLALSFSADSQTLAAAGSDSEVRLIDVTEPARQQPMTTVIGHSNDVWAVAFNPETQVVASGGADHTVRLQNLAEFTVLGQIDTVLAVTHRRKDRTVATAGVDGLVRLWRTQSVGRARLLATLKSSPGPVAFSADGDILAAGGRDGTVKLWDVADPTAPKELPSLGGRQSAVGKIAFSPDGKIVATGGEGMDRTVWLWDISARSKPVSIGFVFGTGGDIGPLTFSADARTLAVGSADNAKLWDVTNPGSPRGLVTTNQLNSILVFSPDSRVIAAAGRDSAVRLWDVSEPQRLHVIGTLAGHTAGISSITYSPDGRRLATASPDGSARVWDLSDPRSPRLEVTLTGHTAAIHEVMFTDDHALMTVSRDNLARRWEIDTDVAARRACRSSMQPMTVAEWQQYFPSLPFQQPCPDYSAK